VASFISYMYICFLWTSRWSSWSGWHLDLLRTRCLHNVLPKGSWELRWGPHFRWIANPKDGWLWRIDFDRRRCIVMLGWDSLLVLPLLPSSLVRGWLLTSRWVSICALPLTFPVKELSRQNVSSPNIKRMRIFPFFCTMQHLYSLMRKGLQ